MRVWIGTDTQLWFIPYLMNRIKASVYAGSWRHAGSTNNKMPGKAALLQACSLEHFQLSLQLILLQYPFFGYTNVGLTQKG
jgi:hypothetical protein